MVVSSEFILCHVSYSCVRSFLSVSLMFHLCLVYFDFERVLNVKCVMVVRCVLTVSVMQ